jgi:hypothetical protein
VTEHDMGEFMERSLVRELSHGIDSNAALERVSLGISIDGLEFNPVDT